MISSLPSPAVASPLPPEAVALARVWSRPRAHGKRDVPSGAWLTASVAWELATRPNARCEWFDALDRAGAFARGPALTPESIHAGLSRLAGFGRARSLRWALGRPDIQAALAASPEAWVWWDRCVWAAAFAAGAKPGAADRCLQVLLNETLGPSPSHVLGTLARCLNEAVVRGRLDSVDRLLAAGAPLEGAPGLPPALTALLTSPSSVSAFRRATPVAWQVFDRLLETGARFDGADPCSPRRLGEAALTHSETSAFAVARWNATMALYDARRLDRELSPAPSGLRPTLPRL